MTGSAMTGRRQRLAGLVAMALLAVFRAAPAAAFVSPGESSLPRRGIAVYDLDDLDDLDASQPHYDARVPAWIFALPRGFRCALGARSEDGLRRRLAPAE